MPRSCDTMVALPETTRHKEVLFAKNSDRPANECQPLIQRDRRVHTPGARAKLKFVEIPETSAAYRHVGSAPYWCWGYEHGFNEHQVVIGNEGLYSKLTFDEPKLIGMELVRLGLERGRTAAEALEVMTEITSRYGQGTFTGNTGPGNYDNSFIIADPREAYVLETAGHHWAAKRVTGTIGISNVYSVETDWDRLSPQAEAYATEQGWWDSQRGRFDFAASYSRAADRSEGSGARRRARSCAVLAQQAGHIDTQMMMRLLSDHSDGAHPAESLQTENLDSGGICLHYREDAPDSGNTAASLVADLCADGTRLPVYWCSFYSPCLGVFLPVFMEGELPPVLAAGGADPSDESPWWLFYRLSHAAREQGAEGIAIVRQQCADLQQSYFASAYPVAAEACRMLHDGQAAAGERLLAETMRENVARLLAAVKSLLATLESRRAVRQPAAV
jgi:secernin